MCVLASRCLVVCIVMARHGVLVLIDGARTLAMAAKRPEPDDVQDITQLFVFLAVPASCGCAYAAICPVDAPQGGATYAKYLFLFWAVLCVVNAATWATGGGLACVVRTLLSLSAGATYAWLGWSFHKSEGKGMWPRIRLSLALLNSVRMVGIVVLHTLMAPPGYPPGQLSFRDAALVNVVGLLAAAAMTPKNRLRIAAWTGAATIRLKLGELTSFEAAAALGVELVFDNDEPDFRPARAPRAGRAASEPRGGRVTWSDRESTAVERPAVVEGARVPVISSASIRESTCWGSFGRGWGEEWAADWQRRREAEIESERRRVPELELALVEQLRIGAPQPAGRALPLPPQQPGMPAPSAGAPAPPGARAASGANTSTDAGAPAQASSQGGSSDTVSLHKTRLSSWGSFATQSVASLSPAQPLFTQRRGAARPPAPTSLCSSESHHGSHSDRSEAQFIATTKFLRFCSAHGMSWEHSRGADVSGLSGFGSTEGSTERGPASSRGSPSVDSVSNGGEDSQAACARRRACRRRRARAAQTCMF